MLADYIDVFFCLFLCSPSQLFEIAGDRLPGSEVCEARTLVDSLSELSWPQREWCTISKDVFLNKTVSNALVKLSIVP